MNRAGGPWNCVEIIKHVETRVEKLQERSAVNGLKRLKRTLLVPIVAVLAATAAGAAASPVAGHQAGRVSGLSAAETAGRPDNNTWGP
jgi:2-methylisocitrate lyase-like PEP mutase family enzyme